MSTHPRENSETQSCRSSEIVPTINFVTSVGAVEESNEVVSTAPSKRKHFESASLQGNRILIFRLLFKSIFVLQ